ncbi:hypothetical protein BGZ63DRAFT_374021 [Mariannaea sp. PMI_226]|nr:hypothetical protein BGZ63DRAFT_374021 [Mariannaea sp. PMI_226]
MRQLASASSFNLKQVYRLVALFSSHLILVLASDPVGAQHSTTLGASEQGVARACRSTFFSSFFDEGSDGTMAKERQTERKTKPCGLDSLLFLVLVARLPRLEQASRMTWLTDEDVSILHSGRSSEHKVLASHRK